MLFFSCQKEEEFEFFISIENTNPISIVEFQENIIVTLNYQHNQGFVGFADPDHLSLEIKDSRLVYSDYYHIIPVTPPNQVLSVTGEILIEIDAPFLFGNGNLETLTYTIRIQDKNNEWSNEVTTPIITVTE